MKSIFRKARPGRSELPIVVGGFYRSGTSLVRRLLDAHSRIHCGPEVKFFKDFYGDYPRDELRHVRLFGTLASLGLTPAELLPLFGGAFVAAHELAARKAGKARWADKNPENVLYLRQWQGLLPGGFLFVHVVRHPLDALASLKEVGFPKAVPPGFADKARLFLDFHRAAVAHSGAFPDSSIQVRYEDLTTRPEETLVRLFAGLGEVFEPAVLSDFFLAERGAGIEDPKVARTRSVHAQSVGRWRADLDAAERSAAEEILGPLIEGY